jgi:hypothetical protein
MEKAYNLVLVATTKVFDPDDFVAIGKLVEEMAPDINVFIADSLSRSGVTRKKAARLPTLVFSPMRLMEFRPLRGKVYCGRPMSKLIEMELLSKAGLPVPEYEEMKPDTSLSVDRYGRYVILKPSYEYASFGSGIELFHTTDAAYRAPETFPEDHAGRRAPMIVQRYIDCGAAMSCRVLTVFGVPVFTYCRQSTRPLMLDSKDPPYEQSDYLPAPPHTRVFMEFAPDILELARRAYLAVPDVPLQACDILRDKDGGLHLLEINPGGATWMFSTHNAAGYKKALGIDDLAAPFDAFGNCARLLVERTRAEAE